MTALALLAAVIVGAAWRRWFGSERPRWAWTGYRAAQITAGAILLGLLCWGAGDAWWRALIDTAAAMVVMTVSAHTRDPFIWIAEKLHLPKMWGDFLDGPAPWAEALQGATLWSVAVAI